MKKTLAVLLVMALTLSAVYPAYASDWDKAGIALTGIEGLRIITGGKVDLIGSMFGINRDAGNWKQSKHRKYYKGKHLARHYDCTQRVWAPNYKWKKKYIPEHEGYDERYGKVIVEGHYIKYKVERGGHWEIKDYCD